MVAKQISLNKSLKWEINDVLGRIHISSKNDSIKGLEYQIKLDLRDELSNEISILFTKIQIGNMTVTKK